MNCGARLANHLVHRQMIWRQRLPPRQTSKETCNQTDSSTLNGLLTVEVGGLENTQAYLGKNGSSEHPVQTPISWRATSSAGTSKPLSNLFSISLGKTAEPNRWSQTDKMLPKLCPSNSSAVT